MPPNLSDPRWVQFRRLLLGTVIESLLASPSPGTEETLARSLRQAWLSLLGVLDLPIGDKLTSERDDVAVLFEAGDTMVLRFDLEAD
jgi:hypothetical protein